MDGEEAVKAVIIWFVGLFIFAVFDFTFLPGYMADLRPMEMTAATAFVWDLIAFPGSLTAIYLIATVIALFGMFRG